VVQQQPQVSIPETPSNPDSSTSTPEAGVEANTAVQSPPEVQQPSPEDTAKAAREERRKAAQEKAAAAKANQVGDLHITSTPAGASVSIDGRHETAWITPFTAAKLPAGAKTIVVTKDGFATKELKTEVVTGKATTVDAQLAQSVGMINVRSTPAGAEILLDDKPTGKTTPSLLVVPPGEHTVRVTKQGFEPSSQTMKISESQRLDFAPALTASVKMTETTTKKQGGVFSKIFGKGDDGTLIVRSNPPGARVQVLGVEKKSFTAPGKAEVKPGKYDVTVTLSGYKTIKRTVTVEKGKTLGIEETLEKQ